MIFAEVKSPVQVRSGTDKDNLVRCMRAELDLCKSLEESGCNPEELPRI